MPSFDDGHLTSTSEQYIVQSRTRALSPRRMSYSRSPVDQFQWHTTPPGAIVTPIVTRERMLAKPTVHKPLKSMVPLAGIEPALPRGNLILSQLLSLGGAARLGRLSSTGLTTRPMGTLATHRAIRGCVARDQSRIPRFRLPTAYQDWQRPRLWRTGAC